MITGADNNKPDNEQNKNLFVQDFFSGFNSEEQFSRLIDKQDEESSADGVEQLDENGLPIKKNEPTAEERLKSSTEEGIRLSAENKLLKEQLLSERSLKTNPEDTTKAPKSIKEALNLPEDFQPDMEEAMRDPKSDSGRYFAALMQINASKAAENIVREREGRQNEEKFRATYNLQEDGAWDEFVNYAKGKTLTLEDIYLLKNWKQISKDLVSEALKRAMLQKRDVSGMPNKSDTSLNKSLEQLSDEQIFSNLFPRAGQKNGNVKKDGFFSIVEN